MVGCSEWFLLGKYLRNEQGNDVLFQLDFQQCDAAVGEDLVTNLVVLQERN